MGARFCFGLQPHLENDGRKKQEKERYIHMEKNTSCLSLTNFYDASALNTKKDNS